MIPKIPTTATCQHSKLSASNAVENAAAAAAAAADDDDDDDDANTAVRVTINNII